MWLPYLITNRCVRVVVAGSANYTTPGSYNLLVPEYDVFNADFGGGGGGGGAHYLGGTPTGGPGGRSGFSDLSLYANGGAGGNPYNGSAGTAGANGTGVGGDTNTTGGGALGGAGMVYFSTFGGKGGNGGRTIRSFNIGEAGAPVPGTLLAFTVGVGGYRGGPWASTYYGVAGQPGWGKFNWS